MISFVWLKRNPLTLFRVRCHLLHESNEVEQELSVVVGQFQVIAVLPEEQTFKLRWRRKTNKPVHSIYTLPASFGLSKGKRNTKWRSIKPNHTQVPWCCRLSCAACMSRSLHSDAQKHLSVKTTCGLNCRAENRQHDQEEMLISVSQIPGCCWRIWEFENKAAHAKRISLLFS